MVRRATFRWKIMLCLALLVGSAVPAASVAQTEIEKAIAGAYRLDTNRSRDIYRHPRETLMFFGLAPHLHVVEVWPGGGWYTEILAPVLRENGKLYAAHYFVDESTPPNTRNARAAYLEKLAKHPAIYDKVVVTALHVPKHTQIAPKASVDLVLTFRNVHNWSAQGNDEAAFKAFYDALKPGGVLGVVEHRAQEGASMQEMKRTGYITETYVIRLAERAGLRLVARSEINANARDTRDHAHGVWSLPPSLSGGAQDRDKYLAIGESDRMTLKFVKPR